LGRGGYVTSNMLRFGMGGMLEIDARGGAGERHSSRR